MIYALTNGGLYVCFSILLGTNILALLSPSHKVEIAIRRHILILLAVLIPVITIIPVLELTITLGGYRDTGLLSSFIHVLTELDSGRVWGTLLLLVLFYIGINLFSTQSKVTYIAGIFLIVAMVFVHCTSGHGANIEGYKGTLYHTFHMLAVCAWAGILLVVSWFSSNDENWRPFVHWFTRFAVVSVLILTITGIIMSFLFTESIVSSWTLPYGQALLIKHLLFFAMLIFAFMNGFLIKKKVKNSPSFSPRRWWRAESFLILSIFSVTGFMTEQETPQNIAQSLSRQDPSILFQTFTSVDVSHELMLSPNLMSVLFVFVSLFFTAMTIYSFIKRESTLVALFMVAMAVFSLYVSLMNSVANVV
ncbi:copper resistance D family protein [Halobacillus sp. K22]|uniref:copper resistance D family protein n=1 Tax=Halobacillus sp. K22 TaxID=3457431 RepID=UPI003FCDACE4